MFKKRENVTDIEEGKYLSPKFNEKDLIPVITMDVKTKEILMHGYMNDEALKKQLKQKRFIIGVDQKIRFGIKERLVDLDRK